MSGPLQARHAVGVPAVRRIEVAVAPVGEPRRPAAAPRPRWSSAPARSSARRACVRAPATSPRSRASPARYIAISVGRRRNPSRPRRPCPPAGPGSPLAPAWRPATARRRCRRASTPLDLAGGHERPDEADAQHRPDAGPRRRAAPRASAAASPPAGAWRSAGSCQLDQVGRALEVLGGQGVLDRLGRSPFRSYQSLARRCSAGTTVGLLVQQARTQHVGEEVVVAVPPAAVVERDQEEVAPLERLQRRACRRPDR